MACSVCLVKNRLAVIMIPVKVNCTSSWNREYYGYRMTEGGHGRRYMYECNDKEMDIVQGNGERAVLLSYVEAACDKGLVCDNEKYSRVNEINCVVCSK